jgi:hypothetical protein
MKIAENLPGNYQETAADCSEFAKNLFSGLATNSNGFRSAATPQRHATSPPAIISPAPRDSRRRRRRPEQPGTDDAADGGADGELAAAELQHTVRLSAEIRSRMNRKPVAASSTPIIGRRPRASNVTVQREFEALAKSRQKSRLD